MSEILSVTFNDLSLRDASYLGRVANCRAQGLLNTINKISYSFV